MSLSGTFSTMPFPDLLNWLAEVNRTGLLTVALEFEERYLGVRNGVFVSLGSDDPRVADESRVLVTAGLLDDDSAKRLVRLREETGRTLTELLPPSLPQTKAAAAVRAHAREVLLQLFLWQEGRFVFSDERGDSVLADAAAEGLHINPPLPPRELLMDGIRRLDEWKRIAAILPSDYVVIHALGTAPDLPTVAALAEAAEPLTLGELCLRLPRPRFDVVSELFMGWQRGLVAVDASPTQLGQHAESPATALIATGCALLDERQYDEAAALLRSALDLDPYRDDARELLARARAEHLARLYQEMPPFRVPVIASRGDGLRLSPRERFLLSRIDGKRDVGTLAVMTPVGELETLRALKHFAHVGLISWKK